MTYAKNALNYETYNNMKGKTMSVDYQLYNISEKLDRIADLMKNRKDKTWYSVSDVVKYSGISRSTLSRALKSGALKSVKNGGKLMFRREWIDSWGQG